MMGTQFFILGHVLLLALSLLIGAIFVKGHEDALFGHLFLTFIFFLFLEIVYWVLHWFFI